MSRLYWTFFVIFSVGTVIAAMNNEWFTSAIYAFVAGLYMLNICLVRMTKNLEEARTQQEQAQSNYLAALRELNQEGTN